MLKLVAGNLDSYASFNSHTFVLTLNNNYYFAVDRMTPQNQAASQSMITLPSNYHIFPTINNLTANQWYSSSAIYNSTVNYNSSVFKGFIADSSSGNLNGDIIYFDNLIVFNSSSYTKSQIDDVIAYFGYFPYNTTLDVPSVSSSNWGIYSLAYVLENASSYTGTLTDLADANTFHWQDLQTDYSITLSNADRAYYWQLYEDAVAEVDRAEWYYKQGVTSANYAYYRNLYEDALLEEPRWEWYRDMGVTSSNYVYYEDLYQQAVSEVPNRWEWYSDKGITALNFNTYYAIYLALIENYGSGIAFATFDGLTVSYDREDVEPYVPPTLLEGIEDYIDAWGLGDFPYIFISVVLMALVALLFGILRAPMVITLVIEGIMFLMFSVFGWFPIWLVILMIIVLFAVLVKLLKGGGATE